MDRFEGKYLLLSKTEACLESTLRSSAQAKIATSTLLLACRHYCVLKIYHALHLEVIIRREMTLKCKVLSVVISMESPFPFNSRESITFCLISAVMAPKKRCRSQHVEGSAFEKSSRCTFQVVEGRVALPLSFTAMLALTLPQKWLKMSLNLAVGLL